jgi:hypothetical protein
MAAVYSPGVKWGDAAPAFDDGPVYRIAPTTLKQALSEFSVRTWLQPIDRWKRCVLGYHPPSISPTRLQLIAAGFPFCSLQATTQHLPAP